MAIGSILVLMAIKVIIYLAKDIIIRGSRS